MALPPIGANWQVRIGLNGTRYYYNPNTGRWFDYATHEPIQPTIQFYENQNLSAPEGFYEGQGTIQDEPGLEEEGDLLDEIQSLLSPFFDTTSINDLTQNIIRPAIIEGLNATQIKDRIYQSDIFKTYFPEWQQRIDNGFMAMEPVAILDYRDKARQIAKQWSGVDLTNEQIASFITSNRSLVEFRDTLETWEKMEALGPEWRAALELEAGRPIPDDEAFMFLSNDYSTPELDNLYRQAAYKGFAKKFNLRPISEEEVGILNKQNVTVEQAMQGYQTLASNLPTYDRLYAIDQAIAGDSETPFQSMGDLFRTVFAQDPETQLKLSQSMAREVARWAGGGGVAGGGLGLLTPGERR